MFSAFGKAMNKKIISWGGGGTVTALFERRTTKLTFFCKLHFEPGCREKGLKT